MPIHFSQVHRDNSEMVTRIIILGVATGLGLFCTENARSAEFQQDLDKIKVQVEALKAAHFPDLSSKAIEFTALKSASDYFQASVKTTTLTKKHRTYILKVNPVLFEDPPSEAALASILAHELTHIGEYRHRNWNQMVFLGLKYVFSRPFRIDFERDADLKVLELGLGEGLKDYRLWLYDRIDTATLAEKRKTYFTPEEIEDWIAEHR